MILRTVSQTDYGTYGILLHEGETLAFTCEDAWLDNQRMISCIPAGEYQVIKRVSPKYGHHWHILDVPNRSLILIHCGNTPADTNGCILVGAGFMRDKHQRIIGVHHSKDTMETMRRTLPNAFTLEVER